MIYRAAMLGAAGSAFSPLDVSGLQLWLDASDLSTITESGGAVSQWDDKSGANRHATQGAASRQPATGTATINGRNAIRFDGSDDVMQAIPALGSVTGLTVFLAGKFRSNGSNQAMLGASNGSYGSSDEWFRLIELSTDNSVSVFTPTASTTVANGTADTNPHVFELGFDGGSTLDNVVDGTSQSSATTVASLSLAEELDLGALNVDAVFSLPGAVDIGEVLIYSNFLSGDRTSVREYLADKWGVTLA